MQTTRTRAALIVILALTVLSAWGCRRRPPVTTGGALTARQHTRLLRYAQRHSGCPAAQLSAALMSTAPDVYTVSGCAQPADYWLQCSRRRCRWQHIAPLHEQAARLLQCPSQQIQQQPTQAPNMRAVSGCGRILAFTMSCTDRDCAWYASSPVQAQGVVGAAPPPQYQPQYQQQQVTAGVSAQVTLQAQVQQQREAVMSCLDPGQELTLGLRWTEQGQVIIQLPPNLAGTAAEGCIQAALGALQVAAQRAGELQVPMN